VVKTVQRKIKVELNHLEKILLPKENILCVSAPDLFAL